MSVSSSSVVKKVIRKKVAVEDALASLTISPAAATIAFDDDEDVKPIKAKKKVVKPASDNDEKQAEEPISGDCSICCQAYTKLRRRPTKCMFCPFELCTECLQRYLLSQADAHCMDCKKVFPKEYLHQHLSKAFVKDRLSHHYSDVLANLEKSLFPSTMQELEVERLEAMLKDNESQVNDVVELTSRLKRVIHAINSQTSATFRFNFMNYGNLCVSPHDTRSTRVIAELTHVLEHPHELFDEFTQRKENEDYSEDMKLFEYNVNYLQKMIYDTLAAEQPIDLGDPIQTSVRYSFKQLTSIFNLYISILESFLKQQFDINESNRKKIKKPIVVRCIVDKCPGYVSKCRLSDDDCTIAVCGVCKGYSCYECLVKLDGPNVDHNCDEDLIKTIRLIARESKPCPSCKTPIQRTEGCPQMFCISCHTAFDWTTNQIVTGRIHNPHYFAWLENLSEEEQKAEAQRRQTNTLAEAPVQLDEYGCPIGNNHMFTRELISHIMNYKSCFNSKDLFEAVGLRLIAIIQAYQLFSHMIEINMEDVRVEADPTLRYKQFRKDLLRGHKEGMHRSFHYTETKWRQDLHTAMVDNERKHNSYQLYQATIAIAWNIYQQLEASFRAAFEGQSYNGLYGSIGWKDLKFKSCMPAVREAYQQLLDLAKYYNEHSRKLTLENGHTTYSKMIVPSPELIESKSNPGDEKTRHMMFSMKVSKVSDNELNYKIDVKSITTLAHPTQESTLSSTCCDTNDEKVQFSSSEEKFIRLMILVEEVSKPILDFDEFVYVPKAFNEAVQALEKLVNIPELATFHEDIQAQIKACSAAKQRVDILKDTYKAIHATILKIVIAFRETVEVVLREFHWTFNKSDIVHQNMAYVHRIHSHIGVSRYQAAVLQNRSVDINQLIVGNVNKHLATLQTEQLTDTEDYLFYKRYLETREAEVLDLTNPIQSAFKHSDVIKCKVIFDKKKVWTNHFAYKLYKEELYTTIPYGGHQVKLPRWLSFLSGFELKKHTLFLDATLCLCARSIKSCPAIKLFDPVVFPCWIDGQEATAFEVILLPFLQLEKWSMQDLTFVHDRLQSVCGAINEGYGSISSWNQLKFKLDWVSDALVEKVLQMYLSGLISISVEPTPYLKVANFLCGKPKDFNTFNRESKTLKYFASNVWYLAMNCMLNKVKITPDFHKSEATWEIPDLDRKGG